VIFQCRKIAGQNGMKTRSVASLQVYSPRGAPPVLAWIVIPMVRRWANGERRNGEIITFDVTDTLRL
jgi:hypothetical protein